MLYSGHFHIRARGKLSNGVNVATLYFGQYIHV